MKTKYFRFLYQGLNGCLMHRCELEDTAAQERFIFIYLSGTDETADQKDVGNTLFLCPETVDLVVAGDTSPSVRAALEELLGRSRIRLLAVPEAGAEELLSGEKQAEEVVCIPAKESLQKQAAGWNFFIKSYEPGRLSAAHGPREALAGQTFEDCVMHVHPLDGEQWEKEAGEQDGYAWAMGRTLYEDYDVCRHQRRRDGERYVAGNLLLGRISAREHLAEIQKELGEFRKEIRFVLLPGLGREADWADKLLETENRRDKQYWIGLEPAMEEKTAARLVFQSPYQIPVLAGEGRGLRCGGFLKYKE